MRYLVIVLFVLLKTTFIQAQEDSYSVKFVGYDGFKPVFLWQQDGNYSLYYWDEKRGEATVGEENIEFSDILSYDRGQYVGVTEYGEILLAENGSYREIRFQEDLSEEGDFRDRLLQMNSRMGVPGVAVLQSNSSVIYPRLSGFQLIRQSTENGEKTEADIPELAIERGSIIGLYDTERAYYLMVSVNGPYELYQIEKQNQSVKKAPFTLGRTGGFGLAFHPSANEVLLIYRKVPVAYNFDTNKFQKIEPVDNFLVSPKSLQTDFNRIFYSKTGNSWKFMSVQDGKMQSRPLKVGAGAENYTLTLEDVEELVNEHAEKNMSVSERFKKLMQTFKQLPKPYTDETKRSIEEALQEFEDKYADQVDGDPMAGRAMNSIRIIRLDTSMVTLSGVKENEKRLLEMINKDQMNYQPLLAMQLLGSISTTPKPVHPSRIN
ncbi:MAG: hypothetical protein WBA74_25125, partial [Cyclobacteriaceae bacterium]